MKTCIRTGNTNDRVNYDVTLSLKR